MEIGDWVLRTAAAQLQREVEAPGTWLRSMCQPRPSCSTCAKMYFYLAPGASELVLCEAIVTMAHKLGLQVIAEGVATQEQRAWLLEIGCDFAQGELFAPPLTIETFDALLHAQRPLHP